MFETKPQTSAMMCLKNACLVLLKITTFLLKPIVLLILDIVVPRSGKEILLLASIYGVVNKIDPMVSEFSYDEINDTLDLATNPRSLQFPLVAAHWIWDQHNSYIVEVQRDLDAIVRDRDRLYKTAKKLVEMVPMWIIYDNKRNIVTSVMNVLSKSKTHKQSELQFS